jgi:hypothetical protein
VYRATKPTKLWIMKQTTVPKVRLIISRITDDFCHYSCLCVVNAGGLIVGSTMTMRKSAKPIMKSTLAMSNQAKTSTMTFAEKVRNNKMAYEKNLINSLTVSVIQFRSALLFA